MTHTHKDITDPKLRAVFANELLILRRSMKDMQTNKQSDLVCGIMLGFETALRRVNHILYNVPALSEVGTLFNKEDNRVSAAD